MGQVYVIRKEAGIALSPGGIQQIWMPSQLDEPQRFAGVTGGISDLRQNPVTNQYEAAPIMSDPDDKGRQTELGYREGDKYGARGLNIRSKLNENPDFDYSQQIGPMTADRGQQIADQMARRSAQQKVFDRSATGGQVGANVGRGLAAGIGVLAGAVNLANAGAAGQDAVTGGLGAAQMGSMTYQQGKKPLSEAGGEVGAQIGARSVRVAKPTPEKQVMPADGPQVAAPNPPVKVTSTQQDRDNATMAAWGQDPKGKAATLGHYGPFADRRAEEDQSQALNMIGVQSPYQTNYDKQGNPLTDVQPSPTKIGVTGQPQLRLYGEDGNELPSPQPQVAPATTNTQPEQTAAQSGAAIADATTGNQQTLVGVDNTAQQIKDATTKTPEGSDPENPAAKEMSGKKPSSTDLSMVGKMVGVIGNKRIVGVI